MFYWWITALIFKIAFWLNSNNRKIRCHLENLFNVQKVLTHLTFPRQQQFISQKSVERKTEFWSQGSWIQILPLLLYSSMVLYLYRPQFSHQFLRPLLVLNLWPCSQDNNAILTICYCLECETYSGTEILFYRCINLTLKAFSPSYIQLLCLKFIWNWVKNQLLEMHKLVLQLCR